MRAGKVGSIVFATEQGLGYLAKDFYDNGVLTDVVIIHHGRRHTHSEWYPKNTLHITKPPFLNLETERFIKRMDTMLFFETPFEWKFFDICRQYNTKCVLMPMHECMPRTLPAEPDLFLCPSHLDYDIFGGIHLPIPVPTNVRQMWRQRTSAITFVHNAGNGGLLGRNGTREFCESLKHVRSPINVILRSQKKLKFRVDSGNVNIEQVIGTVPLKDLYAQGDVFVFPEKFNGLSLPLQEARATGMLVMGSRRYPMTKWLPEQPLIPVQHYRPNRVAPRCREFEEAVLDPVMIAAHIDEWYARDISHYSAIGKEWAKENSWENLKHRYEELLCA